MVGLVSSIAVYMVRESLFNLIHIFFFVLVGIFILYKGLENYEIKVKGVSK